MIAERGMFLCKTSTKNPLAWVCFSDRILQTVALKGHFGSMFAYFWASAFRISLVAEVSHFFEEISLFFDARKKSHARTTSKKVVGSTCPKKVFERVATSGFAYSVLFLVKGPLCFV